MRKIVANLFVSLDGVVEAPEKWTGQFMNDEVGQAIGSRMASSDAMLLGRVTYETFAAAFAGEGHPMAAQMNSTPKYVVSTTLESADWENSTLIGRDYVEEIRKLKQQPGKDINMSGSGTLVRSLLEKDLIDELALLVMPIALGSGRRLLEGATEALPLRLADVKTFSTGVVSLTYTRAA